MGNLTTLLYAMPILRRSPSAYVKSCSLRNAEVWNNLEAYLAEYQLITDRTMLKKLTQAHVVREAPKGSKWPLWYYISYSWARGPPRYAVASLLPREHFKKWFYGLFFRLALPFNQDLADLYHIICSPLNFTILFRLIPHLASIGYPSHWISELLGNIIENKVSTVARPPRRQPMPVEDVKRNHPVKKLCTTPFSFEMATLAQLFQPLLPFQLTSKSVPALKDIYKYTFYLPDYLSTLPSDNSLALVLMDKFLMCPLMHAQCDHDQFDLRPLLDPSWGDEVDGFFEGKPYEILRGKGIAVWTAVEWEVEARLASVWTNEEFVRSCIEKEWYVGLFRTDIWMQVWSVPALVKTAVKKGKRFPVG